MENTNSYSLNPIGSCSDDVARIGHVSSTTTASNLQHGPVATNYLQLDAPEPDDSGSHISDRFIKSQIANHPLYPNLVSAFIECQKVGAPPQLASLLEEIRRENHPVNAPSHIGDDPQLDHFMESYCRVLHRYKEELSKPFNEATLFLSNIQSQLTNLCKGTFTTSSPHRSVSDEEYGNDISEKERSGGEVEAVESDEYCGSGRGGDQELKDMLLRKYSGYLSSLRKEFLKKRKKGKLPKDARMALFHWWNSHYRWPYPTEDEKLKLSEVTGLDQKQINNWFINQRKRHWKPSGDMRFAVMDGTVSGGDISGGGRGPAYFNSAGGGRTSA